MLASREVDGEGLSSALARGGRRKKQRHPKVALSWLILVAIQPVAVRYQRTTLNGTLIDIHPCAAVRRLNQVARILPPWCAAHPVRPASMHQYDKLHHVLCLRRAPRLDSGPGCTADNRRHYERPATGRWVIQWLLPCLRRKLP